MIIKKILVLLITILILGGCDKPSVSEGEPSSAEAYINHRADDYQRGQYDEAILDLNKAIEINSRYAEAYFNRGVVYGKGKQRYNQAISDFTKAIVINPAYAEAYTNRRNAYASKNQYDKAILDYKKAIEINPKLAETYNNLGITLGKKRASMSRLSYISARP